MPRFTSREVAIMVICIVTTSLFTPLASDAAGSVFSLRDGKFATRKATVSKQGQLKVFDGKGPLTVDGTVATREVTGTVFNTVNGISLTSGATQAPLYSGTGAQKLHLSSFTAAATGSTAGTVTVSLQVYVSDTLSDSCSNIGAGNFGAAERFTIYVPVGETTHMAYPTPLTYSAYATSGDRLCVYVSATGPTGWQARISA